MRIRTVGLICRPPRARRLYSGKENEHVRENPEDPASARDHRAKPRVALRRPVRLKSARIQDSIEAATENISESGMFIQRARIPVRERFDFSIALSKGFSPIQGSGEVIYLTVDETGASTSMGVHFLELEGESFSLLRQVVAENLPEGAAASDLGAGG